MIGFGSSWPTDQQWQCSMIQNWEVKGKERKEEVKSSVSCHWCCKVKMLLVKVLYLLIYVQQLRASFSIFQWLCCGSHNDLMNYEKWCCWYCYNKQRHTGQLLSKLLHTQTRHKEYLKWNVIKTHFLYLQTLNNVTAVFLTECRRESK